MVSIKSTLHILLCGVFSDMIFQRIWIMDSRKQT